jgi:putative ATP-binding cassette transporter
MKVQKIFSYIQKIYGPKIFLLSLVTAALNLILLMLINRGLAAISAGLSAPYQLSVAFFVSLVTYFLLDLKYQAVLARLSEKFAARIRLELLDRIRKSAYERFEKIPIDRTLLVLIGDPTRIATLTTLMSSFITSAATTIGVLIYIYFLSAQGFLFCIFLVILYLTISMLAQRRNIRNLKFQNTLEEDLLKHIFDFVYGIKGVKIDHSQDNDLYDNYLVPRSARLQDEKTQNTIFQAWTNSSGSILFLLTTGCFLFLLPAFHLNILNHPAQFVVSIFFARGSVMALIPLFSGFASVVTSIDRVEKFKLELGESEIKKSDDYDMPFESLTLRELSYSYADDRRFTVGPIDLEIRKGDLIFVHGGNGSGKSTLVKLLCSLYPAHHGTIMLNDVTIGPAALRSYRDLFGISFTDNHLSANLYGGKTEMDDAIGLYIEQLGLAHKISFKDNAFSGIDLSEGQKKRVSLIQLLVKDKPIYIFDEWAANQDPEFREYFYRNILADLVSRKKAVIVITHDDRYFSLATRLIKLDNGRLFEMEKRSFSNHTY